MGRRFHVRIFCAEATDDTNSVPLPREPPCPRPVAMATMRHGNLRHDRFCAGQCRGDNNRPVVTVTSLLHPAADDDEAQGAKT
jgi:hypothetical protein